MMPETRLLWSSLTLSAALALSACSASDNTDTATDAGTEATGKTIRIATEGAYPPFNTTNADGTLSGFDIDVANALCDQMQAKCDIVAQDWDGIIPGLLAQKYDAVVAGMSITPERQEKVDFTEPYFANTMVWLTDTNSNFDPNAISNLTLGGQRSTTPGAYLQDNYDGKNGNTVRLYDNYDNAYLDLKSGRSDAVLAEKVSAKAWLKDNPEGFGIVGDEIDNDDNIAIAVRKGDPLKDELNKAMSEIRSNGTLERLEKANFDQ
ncbi:MULTISPECIES: transporter substrate-binding domain-containing protein [unclassified Psychrobacter]|uniref:transporter substrate-binding domain-containing protein n=1 Tax=unclassified Psychrobacter TaxID=196806 RepID=UPI0018F3C20E|nr:MULTISPECIES: transporter substrate-binding domain-containing protein [unclassified Psychrobacter]